MGLSDPGRPIASFMFLGPTGVGKTELAKVRPPTMLLKVSGSGVRIARVSGTYRQSHHAMLCMLRGGGWRGPCRLHLDNWRLPDRVWP